MPFSPPDPVAEATVHRGILEDDKPSIRVYTIIGGLDAPADRLDGLRRAAQPGTLDDVVRSRASGGGHRHLRREIGDCSCCCPAAGVQ